MFKKIDSEILYENMNPGYVELYNPWVGNDSQAARENMISTIASISYGNEAAKNPKELYANLLNNKHLSCFEFLQSGALNAQNYGIVDSYRHMKFSTYDHMGKPVTEDQINKFRENTKAHIACFKIKIPLYVCRQLQRHRAFSFLEMSRRYVKDSRVKFEFLTDYTDAGIEYNKKCVEEYHNRIAAGEKAETARGCIPTDVYTVLYAQTNAQGLREFMALRTDKHAQSGIRDLAQSMAYLINANQPRLYTKIRESVKNPI